LQKVGLMVGFIQNLSPLLLSPLLSSCCLPPNMISAPLSSLGFIATLLLLDQPTTVAPATLPPSCRRHRQATATAVAISNAAPLPRHCRRRAAAAFAAALPPPPPPRCCRRRVVALPAIAALLPPPACCQRRRRAAANAAIAFVFILVVVAIIIAVSVTVAAAAFSWLLFVLAPAIAVATGVFVATAASGGSAAAAAIAAKLSPTADIAGGVSGIRTLTRSLISLLEGIAGKTDPNWDSPFGSGPHLNTDLTA
jgi:hypothetical protein